MMEALPALCWHLGHTLREYKKIRQTYNPRVAGSNPISHHYKDHNLLLWPFREVRHHCASAAKPCG